MFSFVPVRALSGGVVPGAGWVVIRLVDFAGLMAVVFRAGTVAVGGVQEAWSRAFPRVGRLMWRI